MARLKNIEGLCYFYNPDEKKCEVYEGRPLGCYLYPIVYLVGRGVIIDELCPMGQTIYGLELKRKGKILRKLLELIDDERTRNSIRQSTV